MCAPQTLQIGDKAYTISEWLKHGERIAMHNGFTQAEISEYHAYIELAARLYQDVRYDRI